MGERRHARDLPRPISAELRADATRQIPEGKHGYFFAGGFFSGVFPAAAAPVPKRSL